MTHNPYHPAGGAGAVKTALDRLLETAADETYKEAYRLGILHAVDALDMATEGAALSPTPPVPNPEAEGEAVVKLVDQIHALLSFTNPIPPIPRTARLLLKRAARALAHPPSSEAEGEAVEFITRLVNMQSGQGWSRSVVREAAANFLYARGVEIPHGPDSTPEMIALARPSSEAEIADLRARLHDEQQDAHAGRLIIADLRAELDRMRQALRICVERDPGLYIHPFVRAALFLAREETGASDV